MNGTIVIILPSDDEPRRLMAEMLGQLRPVNRFLPPIDVDMQQPEFRQLTKEEQQKQRARERTHENVRRRPPRKL